ncbi:hypothetical protein BYT27DRAFT_7243476 [Phlegmacium glaucopus]|nr:hypothetical protein BYT27DRAFT_7243476 [Phlegmacium glaucopus]
MSVIQLDLSRQKLYMSPDDPLPEFFPPPRKIMVTPIYDTPLSGHAPGPFSPWNVDRYSDHTDLDTEHYQDPYYGYPPSRHQRYDSDPFYDPEYPRDRYSRPYRRDDSRRRRSSDYYDSSDSGRPRDDRYSPSYDRSSDRDYSSPYDRASDYDRSSSDYGRSHRKRSSPPPRRSSSQPHRSSSQPHRSSSQPPHPPSTYHEPERPTNTTQKLSGRQIYIERNIQAAHRDPFIHLRTFPDDIQKVLKKLPPSPHFCWSECSGKRKAVCIGINYVGQKDALKGCANDARSMMSFLIKYHEFESKDILLLTDDGQRASMTPTRKNMFDAMNWLVGDAKIHDSLFFHYSGHGGQVKDKTGKEADGLDEVIFPVDFKSTSHIVDNDLFTALVAPLPPGCRLTAVFDSCHSGTILDLPYLHSAHGRLRSLGHITQRAQTRGVGPGADVICFAACKDDETSADSFQGGIAVGAMSYALLKILSTPTSSQSRYIKTELSINVETNEVQSQHLTYAQILQELRKILIPKYNQKAQLSGTHPVDLERVFTV